MRKLLTFLVCPLILLPLLALWFLARALRARIKGLDVTVRNAVPFF